MSFSDIFKKSFLEGFGSTDINIILNEVFIPDHPVNSGRNCLLTGCEKINGLFLQLLKKANTWPSFPSTWTIAPTISARTPLSI